MIRTNWRLARAALGLIGVRSRAVRPYEANFGPAMDLAPFAGRPRIYLIASTPRCGSHFLGHALIATGQFGVPLEYLNPRNLAGWRERFGDIEIAPLFARFVTHRTSPSGWFGLKAHWSQFAPYRDQAIFREHGGIVRALFLRRRDLLAQAISYLIARQTGQWIAGAPRRAEPAFDYAEVMRCAEDIRAQNAAWGEFFAERFDGPVRPVAYETLLADQAAGFAAVAAFLDPECAAAPAPAAQTRRQRDAVSAAWRARMLDGLRGEDAWIAEPQDG